MRVRKSLAPLVLGMLLVLSLASPAGAVVAAAIPGSFNTTYGTPVVVTRVGGPVTFVNTDIQPHDFVALEDFLPKKEAKKLERCKDLPKKKCPLFWSEVIKTGEVTQVQGLENVKAGTQYAFYCTIHPRMQGTLVVGG